MKALPAGNLLAVLAEIPDPRGRDGRRDSLSAMLATVVCAILWGARGYVGIADWIHFQSPEVWHGLGFFRKPHQRGQSGPGTASHVGAEGAGWRGHWGIENRLHWVRGATFREDRSRIRTGSAPEIFAALRNAAISVLRLLNVTNIAAALRHYAYCTTDLLKIVGILKHRLSLGGPPLTGAAPRRTIITSKP